MYLDMEKSWIVEVVSYSEIFLNAELICKVEILKSSLEIKDSVVKPGYVQKLTGCEKSK